MRDMEHSVSKDYRIYQLDKQGRIEGSVDASCEDDKQAVVLAEQLTASGGQIEVWAMHRLVGRFPTRTQQIT